MRHASFCAEKMAFIIGMYEEDKSGETDRIKMRGSWRIAGSSTILVVDGEGWVMRLMSVCMLKHISYRFPLHSQQRAFVTAPTSAHGAVIPVR